METKNNRILFLSYLQAIAIVLVVIYHSFHEYPGGYFGYRIWGIRLLATVRMPIFLFISGYLMVITTRRKNLSWKSYAAGKIRRLLIPFLTLSLVTFFPRALMNRFADDPLEVSPVGLVQSLIHSDHLVIPFFWYLHASLLLLCGTYLLTLAARRLSVPPALLYAGLLIIFLVMRTGEYVSTGYLSLSDIFFWGCNFFTGALYAMLPVDLDRRIPWTNPIFLLSSAVIWITFFCLFEGDPLMSQLTSITAFVTFISLTKILEQRHITILDHLVGANYIIFLLSWYFNITFQQILRHLLPATPWWICTILSIISGIYAPLLIYRVLRRTKHLPFSKAVSFLLGQKF